MQWLLVAFVSVGMIVPAVAMPCCGCCSVDTEQLPPAAPTATETAATETAATETAATETATRETATCCSQKSCCSQQQLPPCCQQPAQRSCCDNCSDCDESACRCSVLPATAVLPTARVEVQQPTASDLLTLTTRHVLPATQTQLVGRQIDNAPPPGGELRLHSWLCVWLN